MTRVRNVFLTVTILAFLVGGVLSVAALNADSPASRTDMLDLRVLCSEIITLSSAVQSGQITWEAAAADLRALEVRARAISAAHPGDSRAQNVERGLWALRLGGDGAIAATTVAHGCAR